MSKKLIELPVDQIIPGPSLRGDFSDESVIPIARSIQECGMQQLPTVDRNGRVIDGHRRVRAQRLLKSATMLVIQEDVELDEAGTIQRQLLERHFLTLKPTEEAAGIRRYLELTGLPQKTAAGKFGLSNGAVTQALAVLAVPEWIQKEIDAGAIPKSAAYSLSRITDRDKQAALARQLIDGSMTRDALIGTVKERRSSVPAATAPKLTRGMAILGDGRSVTVRGAELTLESFIETIEAVLSKARRVRSRGVDLRKFLRMLNSESKRIPTIGVQQ